MDLTEKNGQPSMEEILASIRRIIAEEPQGPNPVIDLNARAAASRTDLDLDEGTDFELPSMFRPSVQPATEKHTPLFGRLTDAIRGASASVGSDARPARFHDGAGPVAEINYTNGHSLEDPSRTHPSLSSLKLSRIEPIANDRDAHAAATKSMHQPGVNGSVPHAVEQYGNGHGAPEPVDTSSDTQPPRQMAAFMDTRFCRMSPVIATVPVAPLETAMLRPADLGSIVPGRLDPLQTAAPQTVSVLHNADAFVARSSYAGFETAHVPVVEYAPVQESPPPVYPHITDMPFTTAVVPVATAKPESSAAGTIDDTTADLLRPMLRQWLADNMPRMVEKALHIEVAESVKTGKKFNGH
jgi:uncharacterized protein